MKTVGEYEYDADDAIGSGAFAFVFKGRHRKTGATVALKCINLKKLGRSSSLLLKEINILKQLHHENIVQLYECITTPKDYFLVMEFCNGGDLAEYLEKKGALSEDTIRLFFRQIANAMKAMHGQGILHRDLKPQNLLLSHKVRDPKPQDIIIKIADFGFARHLQNDMMAATLCGSPMYMAPEVIMSKQYNAKADLWSIGTIIYQCLVGRSPFHASTPNELRNFYEQSRRVEPKVPSGTSPVLTDLLLKLLKRNVAERINFSEFFNHEFFLRRNKTSPVPVPIRANNSFATPNSSSTSDSRSVVESPQVEIDCSPSEGDPLYLKDSSSSDSEDFVMVSHPFSSSDSINAMQNANQMKNASRRKFSAPVISHKPVMSHHKQHSQDASYRCAEDKEVARVHSRHTEARSSFMQRAVERSNSPIMVRYSAALTRRRAGSGSDSDASTQSRPSPVPIPVPTQTENYNRLDRQAARTYNANSEDKPRYPRSRAKSVSPLTIDINAQGRTSPHLANKSGSSVPAIQKALKIIGSSPEFPTILENPEAANSSAVDIPHNFKYIIDNKNETLVARMARAWTAPNFAKLGERYGMARSKSSSRLLKQENEAVTANKIQQTASTVRSGKGGLPKLKYLHCDPASSESIAETDNVFGEANTPASEFKFFCLLSDSICEVAEQHTLFSHDTMPSQLDQLHRQTQKQKQCEQLLLYLKSLQVVATALHTLRNKVKAGSLPVTNCIKEIAEDLNQRYKKFCKLCEETKAQCDLSEKTHISFLSADKILYFRAVGDCHSAALDEMFESNFDRCIQRYKRALLLLEGLSLVTNDDLDRSRLSKYKKGIRYRLLSLEKSATIVPGGS